MTQLLVKQVIEGCTAGLPAQIKYYTQFNQCVKIIDDTLSEVISAAMNDTICGGTGGSGWDNEDGGESKNSSHVQSKFCTCGKKVSFLAENVLTAVVHILKQIKIKRILIVLIAEMVDGALVPNLILSG